MAAPITHTVIFNKIYPRYFKDKDKPKFFVGSIFPDIRYLGKIKREKTHLQISELKEVLTEKSSFLAGVKFHDLTDWLRNCFLRENKKEFFGILTRNNLLPQNYTEEDLTNLNRVSKLLEDQLIYNKIKNWQQYISYLDNIYQEEIKFGVKEKDVRYWHLTLKDYFSCRPNSQTREQFFSNLNWPEEKINKVNQNLVEMKQIKPLADLLTQFCDQFESLLKKIA